jgi:LysM repeat protein
MQSTRPASSVRRLGALVGPALIGALVLSSCGGGESAATQSTLDLSAASTAFVVRPPATTVAVDPLAAAEPGAIVEGTQDYTVVFGDYWYGLVARFDVTIEDLLAVNEWTDINTFPNPGDVILIPPGAKSVAEVAATADAADPATAGEDAAAATPTETIPDAGDNCGVGKYTILDTDTSRSKVASNFDVTVEALDAANVNTPGYGAFFPGLEIVIPAKSDC